MANDPANSIKVLSIDGGGIRGIIPAIIIDALQQRLGKEPRQTFDLIAGTSTGGIITVGIGTACNNGKPYSPQQLVDLYVENGAAIFQKNALTPERELVLPKYSPTGLEAVLARFFGDTEFKSAFTPLLVSSYDLQSQLPFFFKSHKICLSDGDDYNWWVRDIARATSAAPTYFPPFHLARGTQDYALVDGGVFVNNPSMAAHAEARKLYPDAAKVVVVSVGTGDRQDQIKYTDAKDWGLVGWAKHIVPVLMDSVSEAVDYELGCMPGCTYYRLQVDNLPQQAADMDNVTPENIANLETIAKNYVATHTTDIDKACADLKSGRGSDMPGIGRKPN
jgi:patatin-like phospholipase/acyl hydrolase